MHGEPVLSGTWKKRLRRSGTPLSITVYGNTATRMLGFWSPFVLLNCSDSWHQNHLSKIGISGYWYGELFNADLIGANLLVLSGFSSFFFQDVFELFLRVFKELDDINSTYLSKRVKILETVSRCKCYLILLDIDCDDLILDMFETFFSVVRLEHCYIFVTVS